MIIRPAVWGDCTMLYLWQRTPEFRANRGQLLVKTWDEFCGEYDSNLGKPYSRLFVVEDAGRYLGAVQLTHGQNLGAMDFMVAPNEAIAESMLSHAVLLALRECWALGWWPPYAAVLRQHAKLIEAMELAGLSSDGWREAIYGTPIVMTMGRDGSGEPS